MSNKIEWRKSSFSGPNGGECVELATLAANVAVRDSKDPEGPRLVFGREAFRVFVADVKSR
jgi:hypothetical protein